MRLAQAAAQRALKRSEPGREVLFSDSAPDSQRPDTAGRHRQTEHVAVPPPGIPDPPPNGASIISKT